MEPKNSQDLNGVSAKIIKYLRYELATPLVQSWQTNSMRNETRDDDFYVPFARTEHVKKMSYFALPKMWNDLHEQIFTSNPTTFKIAIKNHFLSLTNPP